MISIDTPKMALSMAPTVKLVCSAMLGNKKKTTTNVRQCNVSLKIKQNQTKEKKRKEKKRKVVDYLPTAVPMI
jgi:hypothetical protein